MKQTNLIYYLLFLLAPVCMSQAATRSSTIGGDGLNTPIDPHIEKGSSFSLFKGQEKSPFSNSNSKPDPEKSPKTIVAQVTFYLTDEGKPRNVEIVKISKNKYRKKILKAFSKWRFEPPTEEQKDKLMRMEISIEISPNKSVQTTPANAAFFDIENSKINVTRSLKDRSGLRV